MIAGRFLLIAIWMGVVGLYSATASAQTICPTSTPISNGNPADATTVTNWFSCKAPSDNPLFTGKVGIGTAAPRDVLDVSMGLNHYAYIGGNASGHRGVKIGEDSGGYAIIGGFNYVTGGATDLTLENSGGNVGIGTLTPSYLLDIVGSNTMLRLGSLGAYSEIQIKSTYHISYIGDYSNGLYFFSNSGSTPTLALTPGGPGKAGIGTTTPAQALEVNGKVQVDSLDSSATNLCITSTGVLANCSSSIRYKENIKSAGFGLSEVMAMRPVAFKWKGRDERDFGLIAEEAAKINPLFVTSKNGRIEGVKYPQLVAVLVGAIQEQQTELTRQAETIASLQRQVNKITKTHFARSDR